MNANCRVGPSLAYEMVDNGFVGDVFPILGRDVDNNWLLVRFTRPDRVLDGKSDWYIEHGNLELTDLRSSSPLFGLYGCKSCVSGMPSWVRLHSRLILKAKRQDIFRLRGGHGGL